MTVLATEAKGLRVEVARVAHYGDATNNGVSANFDTLTVVGTLLNCEKTVRPLDRTARVFAPTVTAPAVAIAQGPLGTVHVVPVVVDGVGRYVVEPRWTMAGGNYASFHDSRLGVAVEELLGHHFYGAVAIHDRIEAGRP